MAQQKRIPTDRARVARSGGIAATVLVAAAAIPTAAFQLPKLFPAVDERLFIVGGLLVLTGLVVFNVRTASRKAKAELAEASAVDDFRITMKRALAPMAALLAEMPAQPAALRREHLKRVSDRAAVSLADYLLRHIPDVRANVFWIDEHHTGLFPVAHAGAGELSGPFLRGMPTADSNLEWVLAGGRPRRIGDNAAVPGEDRERPYRSYVSVVIRAGTDAYGMITVDSPVVDAFTGTDEETVTVIAGLLATACAMAYPREGRPQP